MSDGTGALTTDFLKHREVISRTDAQITGDKLTLALFGQNAAKESPTPPVE